MFDNLSNKMTACHDPYRELELYLEQAQEEIGRAVKELESVEEAVLSDQHSDAVSWNDPNDTLLPPPQAFRSSNSPEETKIKTSWINSSSLSTVNRVCHDGNLVDIKRPSHKRSTDKTCSSRISFSSTLTPESLGRYGKVSYSPNTRRRLWQMHPSISFPETSKDLEFLGKDLDFPHNSRCNGAVVAGCLTNSFNHSVKSLTLDTHFRKTRQRSNSDTSAPRLFSDENDDTFAIPRPPSGDVNLLSIWADNLVLELDKSFSGEFYSTSSFSPSSDYSLSPTKADDPLDSANSASHFDGLHVPEPDTVDSCQGSMPGRSLKLISMSPDSGFDQYSCETPDMIDECDSSSVTKCKLDELNDDHIIPNHEHITPPPPEFGDEESKYQNSVFKCNSSTSNRSVPSNKTVNGSAKFCAAVPMFEVQETSEVLQNSTQDIKSLARVIAPKTVELEDCSVLRTTCAVNDVSSGFEQTVDKPSNLEGRYINSLNSNRGYHTISCAPKSEKIASNGIDKWSCTLPRDSEKNPDVVSFQRSVSQSAVSNVNPVSLSELTAFMQRMKCATTRPPSCADVSTDVKEDNENKDAVTQTTPVPLSRSSSFTWVTECDCNEWELPNLNSGSDDSIMEKCSNCKPENRNRKSSSSSSLDISSDDDDCGPASAESGSSSLYLSACSGSSDSFEETNVFVKEIGNTKDDTAKTLENDLMLASRRPLRSSETTLRGSILGDISEEQVTSETVSMKSAVSNHSFADSNAGDSLEQSASFPSTLKASRKNKSTISSPAQPIEPTVLIINELSLKSKSAPVLLRKKRHTSGSKIPESSSSDSSLPTDAKNQNTHDVSVQVPAQSPTDMESNELQAVEACSWLRATGFPQYAQMYEDNLFPIDISIVQKDHAFLLPDSIQSLFRRLNTLNRCVNMKLVDNNSTRSVHTEDSDDEENYALSENWEFQRSSRRWSRITATSDGISEFAPPDLSDLAKPSGSGTKYLNPEEAYCSSHDSVFIDEQHSSPDSIRRASMQKLNIISLSPVSQVGNCGPGSSSGSGGNLNLAPEDINEQRSLRRSGSDRVKEGAKALLRRMESLKGKRKKQGQDSNKTDKPTSYSGTDGSSSSSLTSSPQFHRCLKASSSMHGKSLTLTRKKSGTVHFDSGEDGGAHSDPECRMLSLSDNWKDANRKSTKHSQQYSLTTVTVESAPDDLAPSKKSTSKKVGFHQSQQNCDSNVKVGNCDKRGSYYDNFRAPLVKFNDSCAEGVNRSPGHIYNGGVDCDISKNQEDGEIIVINHERRDSGVGSSLTRGVTYVQASWHCFPFHSASDVKSLVGPVKITHLTVPQILLLRKLSLLKLTTSMEKFSATNRTEWTWAIPKFIRRIRSPDYKDKIVFGVPLLIIQQRTGQTLPFSIQAAIDFLRETALDSTGLFRKSGVRSRIQRLKHLTESNPDNITYEGHQANDVADMLKQYFRELPEVLLTNKLSETFISIFQVIPEDLRLESIQATLMLMPDENRDALQILLELLIEVCEHSDINQMTATNLAVCLAPSLFHHSTSHGEGPNSKRRKTIGAPNRKELSENRAAYECLEYMISNYDKLFSVSEEVISQSRISSATDSQSTSVEEISSFVYNGQGGLKGYFNSCIKLFLKEAKEKYKGFVNVCQYDHVELSYKKLEDGHPLRLWKVSTDVEAPPFELLNRILRERQVWDTSITQARVISRLNYNTEIFQYLSSSLPPHPPCDYCVLRSWRTDLSKGACVLIETSINHRDAEISPDAVRALILTSRFLIEPCGSGKSRITYLSRVDTRGRTPEWYNRAYGHLCILLLIKLRNSFLRVRTDGPETKV